MFEKSVGKPIDLGDNRLVRLTKVEGKVVQIEIYVDHKQRSQIFDYFPDKTFGWKETASHLLILKSLAAYQNQTLIDVTEKSIDAQELSPEKLRVEKAETPDIQNKAPESTTEKTETTDKKRVLDADALAELVKELCHATAPLYNLVNRSYFDNLHAPLDVQWSDFKKANLELDDAQLKIAFLINQLTHHQDEAKKIFAKFELNDEIKKFQAYQTEKIQTFIDHLEKLKKTSLNQEQVQKIFSNQKQMDLLNLPSLGEFLRTDAKTLMADAIASLDEITNARFDQLFSFSAHPLRKQFVRAKSDVEKQLSTHAVRFINSQSPIPKGQLDVIRGYDPTIKSQEGWMDIMPYVTGKTFLGDGVGGYEGLNDVDQILNVYRHSCASNEIKNTDGTENIDGTENTAKTDQNNRLTISLKKPHFWLYQKFIDMLKGKKGPLCSLAAILLGLPLAVLVAVSLVAATVIAMAIDLALFVLQAALLVLGSPFLLIGVVVDFLLQLLSFFSEKFEFQFSLLAEMARSNILSAELSEFFRNISLVRRLKQWILEGYDYCEVVSKMKKPSDKAEPLNTTVADSDDSDNEDPKTKILNKVRRNQAEGFFNLVATKFLSFSAVASFLHIKLKQLVYAIRELRKVLGRLFDVVRGGKAEKVSEKHRKKLIKHLKAQVNERNEEIIKNFTVLIETIKGNCPPRQSCHVERSETSPPINGDSSSQKTLVGMTTAHASKWVAITPWNSRQSENPLDFISDIGLGLVHQLVDPAFENNPGPATLAFVGSIICFGALLVPTVGNALTAKIINALQLLPTSIAKAFMGKSLEAGLATIPTNVISVFLQWKLIYFGSEALTALYDADIEWIKKLFENPEEITLSAGVFVAMGYGVGLLHDIPTDILGSENPTNPFLQGVMRYLNAISNGFAHAFNAVAEESREVAHKALSGPNSLELAFIGLKSSMLFYGLLSGNHQVSMKPLEVDEENLTAKFCTEFKNAKNASEKEAVIACMLSECGIPNKNSTLAKKITDEFRRIENVVIPRSVVCDEESPSLAGDSSHSLGMTAKWSTFSYARNELRELITLIHDMEILGMNVDVENGDGEMTGYRSNADGELMYDALFFAIEKHNQLARKSGLFHEQIDGRNLLHNFYNKYCYAGSSGWHKILFGILLFPITWLWRGFKYLIGTPSMRQQVKKSFSKDFAMFFQLIPDVIAPILRTLFKSILYAVRMVLGVFVLPPLLMAIVGIVVTLTFGLILTPFAAIAAVIVSAPKENKETFAGTMQKYFDKVKGIKDVIWHNLLRNSWVNGYMKFVSLLGSTTGTGSLHRLNVLKAIGAASLYERLTSIADTSFENLAVSAGDLRQRLVIACHSEHSEEFPSIGAAENPTHLHGHSEKNPTKIISTSPLPAPNPLESTDSILGEGQGEEKPQNKNSSTSSSTKIAQALQLPPLNQQVLKAAAEYDEKSETRCYGLQPRDPKRTGQLAAISYQALLPKKSSEKSLQDRLQPVLDELKNDKKSELYKGLTEVLTPQLV